MNSLSLLSPAKVNLYLKVINKRPDGFHNISTVFERIDLCDVIGLKVTSTDKVRVFCDHPHVPTGKKNLVVKVARILKEEYGVCKGVDITIKKHIPVAAGLAGGSSNAATVLMGLNRLWALKLSKITLLSIADRIGSDVAFFIHNVSWAVGTDRGNKIETLNLKSKLWHVIVTPKMKLYSGEVYQALNLRSGPMNILTKKDDNVTILIHNLRKSNMRGINSFLKNDLESAILRLKPSLLKLKERLNSLKTLGVMVSGSGPSVYALVDNKKHALNLQKVLRKTYSQVFVAQTL